MRDFLLSRRHIPWNVESLIFVIELEMKKPSPFLRLSRCGESSELDLWDVRFLPNYQLFAFSHSGFRSSISTTKRTPLQV
jgi:hypothetical protein